VTGSYDPETQPHLLGTGNPAPSLNPGMRPGDNLYSCAVVALDADTGALKWFFQFSPNDAHDYDAVQVPVLVDTSWNGAPRKLMLWANRNGFFMCWTGPRANSSWQAVREGQLGQRPGSSDR